MTTGGQHTRGDGVIISLSFVIILLKLGDRDKALCFISVKSLS